MSLTKRNLDVGSLGLVQRSDNHLKSSFLLSFTTALLSTWSKVAAGAPAIVFTPHVEERNGKSEPVHRYMCLQRALEGWSFSWAHSCGYGKEYKEERENGYWTGLSSSNISAHVSLKRILKNYQLPCTFQYYL